MSAIRDGEYVAKVIEYGIAEPKDNRHDQVLIRFEFEYEGSKRQLTYYGSLHPNAVEHTIQALLNCGMKSDNLSALLKPGALDMDREVRIVVENEDYQGKNRTRIKWVNRVGGEKFKTMDPQTAERRLAGLSGLVRAKRQEMGMDKPQQKPPAQTDMGEFDPDFDIRG